jgi:radical SAM superfamily enzyme YgiQ (UPF0313 family)
MKLLLTSVFKPFGVNDKYGRKESKLEGYHNQVTREQGIFSMRGTHFYRSYGLHLIAENIDVPTVILDFPSIKRFIKEIEKKYENVGVSFIAANFVKAKKMAELVRKYSPESKIILGGHGAMIPDIEKLIDCDYVARGEGVKWMRDYLGENVNKPIKHPLIPTKGTRTVLGVKKTINNGFLLPGNGCTLGCKFCSTSHLFNKKYVPFIKTGKELYDIAERFEKKFGVNSFMIYDENFPLQKKRMLEFNDLIIKNNKKWGFDVFSSANAILDIGLENFVRMNIKRVWIGVESKLYNYNKNKNIDMASLIGSLQDYGIPVLASMILAEEFHTKKNVWEDVDYALSLKPDFIQFMLLGPLPQTRLYIDLKKQGRILDDIPYEEWNGQSTIWFSHPAFTREETRDLLKSAFIKDYHTLGPSILRIYRTKLRGYKNMKNNPDPWFRKRSETLAEECRISFPFLSAVATMAPVKNVKDIARRTMDEYKYEFGPVTLKQHIMELYLNAKGRYTSLKYALFSDEEQHKTIYTEYRL